jgi:hypothetical protein
MAQPRLIGDQRLARVDRRSSGATGTWRSGPNPVAPFPGLVDLVVDLEVVGPPSPPYPA